MASDENDCTRVFTYTEGPGVSTVWECSRPHGSLMTVRRNVVSGTTSVLAYSEDEARQLRDLLNWFLGEG